MVDPALMEQVEKLSSAELAELRDAIEERLDSEVPASQWEILARRVREADSAPDDYVTLDEWKARRRTA